MNRRFLVSDGPKPHKTAPLARPVVLNELPRKVSRPFPLAFESGPSPTFRDANRGDRLMILPNGRMMQPVLSGVPSEVDHVDLVPTDTGFEARLSSTHLENLRVRIDVNEDRIDLSCQFTAKTDCRLSRIDMLPAGTCLNLFDVVNFRNRHHVPATWPEMPLGEAFETNTYSEDWQFAPHPSLLIFRNAESHLLAALADLPVGTFGIHLAVGQFRVKHAYLDYGGDDHGLCLAAGQTFNSPRLRLMLRHGGTVYDAIDAFVDTLVDEQQIPSPDARQSASWWHEPLYCTWIDQGFRANGEREASEVLDEALVREAADVIEWEQLPIRTILLDEGWHVARGQWEPHPDRFPDMRGLVDDLHARGFKVMIWLGWPEVADDAELPDEILCDGGRWRNRHGARFVDFSSSVTQQRYLRPLMRKLFSSDSDCLDFDGFKTDFQADKVHPETPLADPMWRGEENHIVRVSRLLYQELKRHKPDGQHLGCAGHFWTAPYIDVNRTYDVHGCNWREHEQRALMLRHTAPGCAVAYDLHNYLENLEHWFESARMCGAGVQIGNLLYVKNDIFSPARPADADYYRRVRAALEHPRKVPTRSQFDRREEASPADLSIVST